MAPTTAPRTRCAVSISVREGRRSARTPNGTRSTARGTAIAMSTAPSARPEPVSEITSQDRATKWNWSPTTEIASLAHRAAGSPARRARAGTAASGPARWAARSFEDDPHAVAVVVDLEHRPAVARSAAPRGRARPARPGRPGMRSRANFPTAIGRRRLTTWRPASVTSIRRMLGPPPRSARDASPGAKLGGGFEPKPPGGSEPGPADGGGVATGASSRSKPARSSRAARIGAASSAVSRPSDTSRRTSSSGSTPISAPAPEEPRARVLEDLELVRCGLDVEVAALERPEDLEPGGLAAIVGLAAPSGASSAWPAAGRTRFGAASASATTMTGGHRRVAGGTGAAGALRRGAGGDGAHRWRGRRCLASAATPRSRMSPEVVRTDTPTVPAPTTSVRRPRPPSANRVPVAWTSPVTDLRVDADVARRRELHVAADRADHVVLARAQGGLDPDVAARRRGGQGVEPGAPDLEVAGHRAGAQLDRRRGDHLDVARHRLDRDRTTVHLDADVARGRRPPALPGRPLRLHVAAQAAERQRGRPRHLDLEVRRVTGADPERPDLEAGRRSRAAGPCPPGARSRSRLDMLAAEALHAEHVAVDAAQHDAAGRDEDLDLVVWRPSRARGWRWAGTSARSSGPPQRPDGLGGLLGAQLMAGQLFEDLAPSGLDGLGGGGGGLCRVRRLRCRRRRPRWPEHPPSSRGPKPSARISASTRARTVG